MYGDFGTGVRAVRHWQMTGEQSLLYNPCFDSDLDFIIDINFKEQWYPSTCGERCSLMGKYFKSLWGSVTEDYKISIWYRESNTGVYCRARIWRIAMILRPCGSIKEFALVCRTVQKQFVKCVSKTTRSDTARRIRFDVLSILRQHGSKCFSEKCSIF